MDRVAKTGCVAAIDDEECKAADPLSRLLIDGMLVSRRCSECEDTGNIDGD